MLKAREIFFYYIISSLLWLELLSIMRITIGSIPRWKDNLKLFSFSMAGGRTCLFEIWKRFQTVACINLITKNTVRIFHYLPLYLNQSQSFFQLIIILKFQYLCIIYGNHARYWDYSVTEFNSFVISQLTLTQKNI